MRRDTISKLEDDVKAYIASRLKAVKSMMIRNVQNLLPAEVAPAELGKWVDQVDIDDLRWQELDIDFCLGADDKCWWIRKFVNIPEVPVGWKLAVNFTLGQNMGVWYGAIFYLDRKEYEGFTPPINVPRILFGGHDLVILPDTYKPGDEVELLLKCYTGRDHGPLSPANPKFVQKFALCQLHEDTSKLYFKGISAFRVMEYIDEHSGSYLALSRILKEALKLIDFSDPTGERFYKTVSLALNKLNEDLKKISVDTLDTINFAGIGHAHIDVAWTWPYVVSKEKAIQTATIALGLMEKYPDYIFHQGQPQLYEFIREGAPRVFERIKQAVKKGKWDADGGMWVEPDCNMPSGESLVRQLLYGRRYFREVLGTESKVLWLVDTFGFPHTLPQIAKGCGIEFFVTTKISWNRYTVFPYTFFHWKGPDGTVLPAYFVSIPGYGVVFDTYNGVPDPVMIKQGWDKRYPKERTQEILGSIGWGDGGGGATYDMLEWMEAQKDGIAGKLKSRWVKTYPFLKSLYEKCKDQLPTWDDELFLEYHRGTLTTHSELKKLNRRCEYTLQKAEMVSSLLDFEATDQGEFRRLWQAILKNQFHDVMAGSSSHDVFEEARSIYLEVIEETERRIEELAKKAFKCSDEYIVVFNSLSEERQELFEIELPSGKVLEEEGKGLLPYERIDDNRVLVLLTLPSVGYKRFKIVDEKKEDKRKDTLPAECILGKDFIENEFLKVKIDPKSGNVFSIYDKINDCEVLSGIGNDLELFEDKPFEQGHSGWDIDIIYKEKKLPVEFKLTEFRPLNGKLRAGFLVEKRFLNSTIRQQIYLNFNEPVVYFKSWVDWEEHETLLKVSFPVNIRALEACYEIQYGHIYRPTHSNTLHDLAKFEVPVHKWMDLSEGGYGVSILNDSKYGADIHQNVMRLTLLRAPVHPDPIADRGVHEFTYAVYPHAGSWKDADTIRYARRLNILPVIIKSSCPADKERSFIKIEPDNLIIDVVKKCEDEQAIIVRLYEAESRRGKGRLSFDLPFDVKSACIADMEEKNIKLLEIKGSSVEFDYKPMEIITIKLSPEEKLTIEPVFDDFMIM